MPEQSRGKNARRPKPDPRPPETATPAQSPSAEAQSPAGEPAHHTPVQRSAANASTLRDQPAVAYALAFALLALLLICALAMYLAAN